MQIPSELFALSNLRELDMNDNVSEDIPNDFISDMSTTDPYAFFFLMTDFLVIIRSFTSDDRKLKTPYVVAT